MGNVLSSGPERGRDADHVTCESETMNADANTSNENTEDEFHDAANEDEARAKAKEEEMNEFRKQLGIKREQRKEILARHRAEKEELETSLKKERTAKLELNQKNEQLRELLLKNNVEIPENLQSSETSELSDAVLQMREEFEKLKADNRKLRRDLAEANNTMQGAYTDIADLNGQNIESMKQIQALKEVVSVSKTLISLREDQLNELKEKLGEIERSLSEREANMLSVDLRQEYERQLQNIRTLRGLYEERARLAEVRRQSLARDLEEQIALYQVESKKCKDLMEKVESLETKVDELEETIENKNHDISTCRDETSGLKAEMAVVNKLFSQVLLGYKTKQDLDKLVHRLEENHGLLTHMAEKEDDAEASSALPKLLLELVSQVDESEESDETTVQDGLTLEGEEQCVSNEPEAGQSTTAEEIVENLPKVWRVLMELLSHQSVIEDSTEKITTCYKSVETKSGPVLVPSVSQTYIRLKDLIVEKLGLVKEVNRMKQLNSHLECRLQEQEKRLCLVTTELSKTWHVVGKLRRHHYQLHTHEKILKYELQQKRKLLNELKEELEYCREKWEQAREKNNQSERDWRKLRAEFSSRKTKPGSPSFNNSGESGYSDERPSDESSESNDESEYVAEPLNRCKKKMKMSFENILDSSADCNFAEREDPVSDMLDVADLPLDTQDGEDNHEATSECSKSENILKSEKTCETEDEIADIVHDDIPVEESIIENKQPDDNCNIVDGDISDIKTTNLSSPSEPNSASSDSQSKDVKLIDPAVILMNIRKQNERLAKKDERLDKLEKCSAALLNKTQLTTKLSDEVNRTLDHLINRPTSSTSTQNYTLINLPDNESCKALTTDPLTSQIEPKIEQSTDLNTNGLNSENNDTDLNSPLPLEDFKSGLVKIEDESQTVDVNPIEIDAIEIEADFKTIEEQSKKLVKTDKKLQKQKTASDTVIDDTLCSYITGGQIIEKLDTLHSEDGNNSKPDLINHFPNDGIASSSGKDITEPSTSTEIDHEARFAARDLRLKRLEEQTKSLVKRVNKTNSKGIKINYKLDELHSIYGSESSRAGTPSEDTEDKSIEDSSKDDDPDSNNE